VAVQKLETDQSFQYTFGLNRLERFIAVLSQSGKASWIVRLYAYEQIDSTNLEARRLWDQQRTRGEVVPFAVRAVQQTAGIGRSGRTWLSPRDGLWMSVVWPMRQEPMHYEAAPLVVGLASAEAIEAVTGLQCQIKWPNDLLINGRKLAGILCQAEIEGDGLKGNGAIVAGIGINGNFTIGTLGEGLRQPPTTLQHELGHAADSGLSGTLQGVRQRLAWQGQEVRLTDTDGGLRAAGRLAGLDDRGHVLIESDNNTQALAIGEMYLTFQRAQAGTKSA